MSKNGNCPGLNSKCKESHRIPGELSIWSVLSKSSRMVSAVLWGKIVSVEHHSQAQINDGDNLCWGTQFSLDKHPQAVLLCSLVKRMIRAQESSTPAQCWLNSQHCDSPCWNIVFFNKAHPSPLLQYLACWQDHSPGMHMYISPCRVISNRCFATQYLDQFLYFEWVHVSWHSFDISKLIILLTERTNKGYSPLGSSLLYALPFTLVYVCSCLFVHRILSLYCSQ